MSMIARWQIQVRFGAKDRAVELMNKWAQEIGPQVGWTKDKLRMLTGSVGALESTIETEVEVKDLAELQAAFDRLGTIAAHKAWGKELEPYVVSGTHFWQVFRTL